MISPLSHFGVIILTEAAEKKNELKATRAITWVRKVGRHQCDHIWRFNGLGMFLKHLVTINLPKSPPFLGNFCKGVKIYYFSSEIIFGQLL